MNNGSSMRANPFYWRTQMIQTVQIPAGSSALRRLCGPQRKPLCQSPWASTPVSSEQFHFDQISFQMNTEFVAINDAFENLRFGSIQTLTFKETEF